MKFHERGLLQKLPGRGGDVENTVRSLKWNANQQGHIKSQVKKMLENVYMILRHNISTDPRGKQSIDLPCVLNRKY